MESGGTCTCESTPGSCSQTENQPNSNTQHHVIPPVPAVEAPRESCSGEQSKCNFSDMSGDSQEEDSLGDGESSSEHSDYYQHTMARQGDALFPAANSDSHRPVTVLVVGCGVRGRIYSQYALERPQHMRVVGVVDPRPWPRLYIARSQGVQPKNIFMEWQAAAARPKFADAVIICTPDNKHADPCVAFARLGYAILLEKPMATTEADCLRVVEAVTRSRVPFCIAHVLRYTGLYRKTKALVEQGAIGEVVNIQHLEPVGYWHAAHSYVRGNWSNESSSSFMLLAKAVHDVDIIMHLMGRSICNVSSFGSTVHFNSAAKPQGATSRCLDCPLESSCAYSAKRLYLDHFVNSDRAIPGTSFLLQYLVPDSPPDIESVTQALKTGPYGRCVYDCDNDVVDNQVVSMQFNGGHTASMTMVNFTEKVCSRRTTLYGTEGEMTAEDDKVKVFNFVTRQTSFHRIEDTIPADSVIRGHMGGDYGLLQKFIETVRSNRAGVEAVQEAYLSHKVCFEADAYRKRAQENAFI